MSEQARQEAERIYPSRNDDARQFLPIVRQIFVDGAKWQASQPVEITDEMVERAAISIYDSWCGGDLFKDSFNPQIWIELARRAIEVALSGGE